MPTPSKLVKFTPFNLFLILVPVHVQIESLDRLEAEGETITISFKNVKILRSRVVLVSWYKKASRLVEMAQGLSLNFAVFVDDRL